MRLLHGSRAQQSAVYLCHVLIFCDIRPAPAATWHEHARAVRYEASAAGHLVDETATCMHCRLSGAASAFSLALRIYDRTTESCWKESQGTRTFVYWIRNISLACAKRSNELLFPIGAAFLRTFETSGGSFNLNWTNCSADGRAVLLQAAPSLRRDKVLRTHIPCHQIVLIALHA